MTIGFPMNTVFWIVMTMFGAAISAWSMLSRGMGRLSLSTTVQRNWRFGAGFVLALWLLIRLALAVFPPSGESVATQFLISITFASLGFLIGLLTLLISPTFRKALLALPQTWLIGIQAIRVGGFFFLALNDMKLLPPAFALPAGYGDMLTGLLALATMGLMHWKKPHARFLAVAINFVGLLDLVIALTTGRIFLGTFTAQLAASGIPLNYLNYVLLIPSFAVPLFALIHLYSLYQLLPTRGNQAQPAEPYQPTRVLTR